MPRNIPRKNDTNYNDIVTVKISVNGKTYFNREVMLNTQAEFKVFQAEFTQTIDDLDLEEISRFNP